MSILYDRSNISSFNNIKILPEKILLVVLIHTIGSDSFANGEDENI